MRLKEIKPGMAIHCKNDEEKKALLEEAERLGYVWYVSKRNPTVKTNDSIGNTIHFYDAGKSYFSADYKLITHSEQIGGDIIEFSDLILPELTAEEAIKIYSEICRKSVCELCPISLQNNGEEKDCDTFCIEHAEKAVEILAQWKAEHEKNKLEVEWVYRVFGAENYGEKFFHTEEEAIKRCEELAKSQKTKQYARYERVCRVME